METVKNIDLLKIKIIDGTIYYNDSILTIKTPKIKAFNSSELDINLIKIELDCNLKNQNRLKEVLFYIKRLYHESNIVSPFIDNNTIFVNIDSDSSFFDSDNNKISKNSINAISEVLCSFMFRDGEIYLKQCKKV